MITTCAECRERIRDCSLPAGGRYVTGWYHIRHGHERCEGRTTMAKPVSLVSVLCPVHRRKPDRDCVMCLTAADVSGYFHNNDRCIPKLCIHPHAA